MREIKFRGKSRDNGKWVYGSLVKGITTDGIMPFIESAIMVERVRVLPESIGQYIGMKDNPPEDTKRTEIYDGDIIRLYTYFEPEEPELNSSTVHKVEYQLYLDYPGFDLVPYGDWECNGLGWAVADSECVGFKVIGNMTDSPERLEEK